MSFFSLVTDLPGQIGDKPRRPKLRTSANLSTLTTAGYLNSANLQGQVVYTTDIFDVWYGYTNELSPGTYSPFTVSISNGVITLAQEVDPGNVLLPVTSGDFAVFNGTTGQIKDAGYLPSNAAKTVVPMMNAAVTANHIAQFTDTAGTIQDGGVLGTAAAKAASDNTKATLASINAAPTSGNLAKFTDTSGTIGDAGAALLAKTTATYAGGGTSNAYTATGLTSSSIVTATILAQTNAASIVKAVPSTDTLTVTFSADPGANTTVNYIAITPAV